MMEKDKRENVMIKNEWDKIGFTQQELIKKYVSELPVKLGALASELGIKVTLSSLPMNCSGLIHKTDTGYEIKINRHESRERQRFTLAHEIAHFLLHRHIIDNTVNGIRDDVLYRSGEPKQIEYEANRLAADLIMPKNQILKRLSKFGSRISEELIDNLAEEFGVSKAAMEIRIAA